MKIFVASSGRCGTGYLYAGFKRFTNINAYHEEPPVIKGELLRQANSNEHCPELASKARALKNRGFYIDTAHQFMRGFYTYALAEIPTLRVIKLARDPLEVGRSMLNRGDVPGKSPWLGLYDDDKNILRLTKQEWESLTDLQKIYLDWLEHEERFDQIKDSIVQVVYVTFDALTKNSANTFTRLFKELGIHRFKIDSLELHKNANKNASIVHPGDQEEFDSLVKLLKSKGYELSWMATDFYKRVIKRRSLYKREIALLDHYNNHPNYTSVYPDWALKQFPIQFKPGMRILDLGCGDGRWSAFIKETYGCEVRGVDFSPIRIAKARDSYPGIPFQCKNAYDFVKEYRGDKFDYVLMTEVLEHLENPEELLAELKRITHNIVGTVPKNFPYIAHLQVFKTQTDFKNRFPDWNIKTFLSRMSPTDGTNNSIYFYSV